jgi:hypothetical protein
MADPWMPGAVRMDIGDHQPIDGGPPKAVPHITWDRNATAAAPQDLVPYENLQEYFGRNSAGKAVAPHILWDPFTGRFTQFVPATSRSKSLADGPGGTRTNRAGDVVIQVEALFFPYCRVDGKVYARLVDTPCIGWARLHDWVKSWGVPSRWPMGRPVSFVPNRSESVWETQAGWYGHSQVPENDHQDPGSWPDFPSVVTPPERKSKMALASKTIPRVLGDDSATTFTAPPGDAWINVSADYVPPGEKVTIRIDVSDHFGNWLLSNVTVEIGNGQAGWKELGGPDRTRMVSIKRLTHKDARLDATLHYPES